MVESEFKTLEKKFIFWDSYPDKIGRDKTKAGNNVTVSLQSEAVIKNKNFLDKNTGPSL